MEFSEKDKFLDWLFNDAHKRLSSTKKRAALTVVAHYGRGYDFNYILAYVRSNEKNCSPIYQGTKIMTLTVSGNKIRFIDSHCFINAPLAKWAGIFGLKEAKECYPHLFNTPENDQYCGAYPALKYFSPNQKKENERASLVKN